MKVETVKIDELISPDYNPRQITPDAMESLKQSLDEFGYIDPLIVNRHNNHVVGGNQRLECLKELGYDEVDVIFINEPDINREKAINIRLNNNSGEWDNDKLQSVFNDLELTGFNVELTGFNNTDINVFEDESLITQNETTDEPPNFEPSEDPQPRLDVQDTYRLILIFDNEFERDSAKDKLTKEGYLCKLT